MPIKLNDLLKLTPEELANTKIRFCQHNGETDPIELFKRSPNELLGWHYWNSQKYKPGQLAIGVVKMNFDEWLFFTVGRIIKDLKLPEPGVGYEYETLGFFEEKGIDYSDYYGRVVISYHKKMMSQFPNANTVIDDFIVKEILPSQYTGFDFPGYENVSLSFLELETIINGNYPSYKNALEHQQAVYVITDKNTGQLYIGSATSKDKQLLARWKGYITTFHNGNAQLRTLYEKEGSDYFRKYFQYSIMENFNANVDYDYIIKRESYWKDNEKNDFFKSLKVLAVGNSFSDDAMEYVYQIAADYGIKQIVLGNLYIGGASLQIHYANSLTDDCDYEYRKNTIGNWENKSNVSLKTGLIDEGWDIVTLQQASGHSGEVSSYYPHLQYLIHYLKNLLRNPLAKIAWHLTWAYQQNSDHKDFPKYNNDQITMYQQIIAAVTSNIITNPEIDLIIPTGTAIQNLRTSYLGDTLTRDGFHLSFDIGRYTAGMVFFQALTGFDCQKINYKPKGVSAKDLLIIKEAVKNAILNSYEITISWTNKIKLSQ